MFKKDKKTIATVIFTVFISFVFIQSLFFKFAGAPETVHIFTTLDNWANDTFGISGLFLSPGVFNAYVIGSAELGASIMLITGLITKFKILTPLGALMALGIISGAITFHLFTPLGIEVQGDGGTLFFMACGVWLSSVALIIMHKDKMLNLLKRS
ncbi:MAG: DoxX family membrane protein [Bdellovibrionales bacterium]